MTETPIPSRRGPLLTIAVLTLAVGNAGAGVWGWSKYRATSLLSSQLARAQSLRSGAGDRLAELEAFAQAMTGRLAGAEATLLQTREEIKESQTKEQEARSRVAAQREIRRRRERELTESKASLAALQQRLKRLRDGLNSETKRRRALELVLASSRSKLQENESAFMALRKTGINVERRAGLTKAPALTATIVKVDFVTVPPRVVIDVGSKQGIELDELFYLIRDGKLIGKGRVGRVTADSCLATISEARSGLRIQTGDRASTRAPRPGA